jgi:hypothetical protein
MTAVEWFAGEIKGGKLITNQKFEELLQQAKEMEKQQIIDAYKTSHISMMTAEQYYNKTFKNTDK